MKQINLIATTCLARVFCSNTRIRSGEKVAKGTSLFFGVSPLFLLLLMFVPLLFLQGGCAKHPSSTAPITGKADTKGEAVVNTARSMMGTRYKNGGTNPDGFDCSGFVCWTYSKYGMNLPRTAKEQSTAGKKLQRHELKPGDLVVFKISNRRGYHSGIYTGDGNFIHSPRKGERIREDSISSNYWSQRFISARRVLNP